MCDDFFRCQLLVARDFDLASLTVGEAAFAAIEHTAQVVHGAEALLWHVKLTYKNLAQIRFGRETYL